MTMNRGHSAHEILYLNHKFDWILAKLNLAVFGAAVSVP